MAYLSHVKFVELLFRFFFFIHFTGDALACPTSSAAGMHRPLSMLLALPRRPASVHITPTASGTSPALSPMYKKTTKFHPGIMARDGPEPVHWQFGRRTASLPSAFPSKIFSSLKKSKVYQSIKKRQNFTRAKWLGVAPKQLTGSSAEHSLTRRVLLRAKFCYLSKRPSTRPQASRLFAGPPLGIRTPYVSIDKGMHFASENEMLT